MTSNADAANPSEKPKYFPGVVKQVLDGGSVVVRGQPRNGPPPERILALADIDAPRLGRRPTANSDATPDEPYSWEAREFLRKLVVGKPVFGCVHYQSNSGREYGTLKFGSNDPETATNVAVLLLNEGLVRLRDNCSNEELKEASATAKTQSKGMHGSDSPTLRDIKWEVENPRELVDSMGGKPVKAVIEHVRDGSTLRVVLLPTYHHIMLMMSGVRCPSLKTGPDGKPDASSAEPYALEAHYFTESRLLHRDVEVVLESVNNKNFVGSVIHPSGNIAEALLKEGFAKCVDWSLKCVTGGSEKYRKAQTEAKSKNLRLWKNHVSPSGPQISDKDREYSAKVVEIVNGDAMMIKRGKTDAPKKIHLASIRPPRLAENKADRPKGSTFRPLYDIPYMFEAREFLRKKLIDQTVNVSVDYIQPENNDFPEKTCCTVKIGGVNVAEALVSKGFATVVRYSADNDQRSSHYDDLLAAEDKAIKSSKGVHDKKNTAPKRIADLTGDVTKSKTFLPFLQRAGRMSGVVEFVASGSRVRVYIPRESCVITFLLSGIQCPRAARTMPGGVQTAEEPYGNEALAFIKEQILQREVEIEVETVDKGGNFIGYLFFGSLNMSVELVENGFACSHFTAFNSAHGSAIAVAEENAKRRRERRWADYVEVETVDTKEDDKKDDEDRKVDYVKVVITEVSSTAPNFYAQSVEEGPKLDALMAQIREEFSSNPPLAGSYTPKKGEKCAAKFVDDNWYRALVEKVTPSDVSVLYIDFGNREVLPRTRVGSLPAAFHTAPAFATEYGLALCALPPDEDYREMTLSNLKEDILGGSYDLNVEYRVTGFPYATLVNKKTEEDVGHDLIFDGLMLAEKRGGRRLAKLVDSYLEAQTKAKANHINMWRYGDITADDAKEFGSGK